jgi:hypothetical protein
MSLVFVLSKDTYAQPANVLGVMNARSWLLNGKFDFAAILSDLLNQGSSPSDGPWLPTLDQHCATAHNIPPDLLSIFMIRVLVPLTALIDYDSS